VRITGWNPFIPLDDKSSSIPCAILEYHLTNHSNSDAEFEFSYHLSHLAQGTDILARNTTLPDRSGAFQFNAEQPNAEAFGSASLSVVGVAPQVKAMWMRGKWFDWIASLWTELTTGKFRPNDGDTESGFSGRNGSSILLKGKLRPGESVTYPIVITWYFPNSNSTAGGLPAEKTCDTVGCCSAPADPVSPKWQAYYATHWKDAADVAAYVHRNFESLRRRTLAFQHGLCSSTMPEEAIDAIASNLAILKSSTVLRLANGNIWGWERCFADHGCCHGTCTHVWNYAQAFPHLFPQLERGLREVEYNHSMDERGHVQFRSALPEGPTPHDYHAAADGQLGGVMKVFRDWQISGDRAWLQRLYPAARMALEFGIRTWDPDLRGALFEPHHNTYDIEFWGPDGMCTSIYLGALNAAAAMAEELGLSDDVRRYRELSDKGKAFAEAELFNGEYFQQCVQWKDALDSSFRDSLSSSKIDPEERRILAAEGPKYQYGAGCLADGVIGAWMARVYGIGDPLSADKVRSSLAAIYKHCFKPDLSRHACTQRPGYATGNEAGLLLCTWPRGQRPTIPFVYSDEVWTGVEYQVASHLIEEGLVEQGLAVVRAVRSRYDGAVRNPFNEYECGSFYARAMASYAVLNSLSGFRYSAVSRTLWFAPKLATRPWCSFFSTATGFGTIRIDGTVLSINMIEGYLLVSRLVFTIPTQSFDVAVSLAATPEAPARFELRSQTCRQS